MLIQYSSGTNGEKTICGQNVRWTIACPVEVSLPEAWLLFQGRYPAGPCATDTCHYLDENPSGQHMSYFCWWPDLDGTKNILGKSQDSKNFENRELNPLRYKNISDENISNEALKKSASREMWTKWHIEKRQTLFKYSVKWQYNVYQKCIY